VTPQRAIVDPEGQVHSQEDSIVQVAGVKEVFGNALYLWGLIALTKIENI
jgi:hypothetical protein